MHATPSRNAPCPCGSGKKYKRCCATGAEPAAGSQIQQLADLYQQGQLRQASQLAEQLLRSDSHNSSLLELGAAIALQAGKPALAIERFSLQLGNQPGNALAHSNLCMALHMNGDDAAAFQHGQQAIALDPELADGWNNLGTVYETGNNLLKAREHYEKSLALDDSDPRVHINAGAVALKLGDYPNAEAHSRAALARQPDYAAGYNNLATALARQGHIDEAEENYRQAMQLQPGNPEFLTSYAVLLLEQDATDQARELLDEAISINPNHVGAYITLGNLSERLNDTHAVARYYDQALSLDADNSVVLCNLGYREFELGNQQAAIDHFNRALQGNPHSAKTLAGLGKALLRQDKVDDASTLIDEVLSLSPLDVHTHIANALLHERLHEPDQAKNEWKFAIGQHPGMSDGYIGLATLYENAGNADRARELYRAAETAGASSVTLYHHWSAMEERLHRLDAAATLAGKVLELDPDYAGLTLIQAKLVRRNKDYAGALEILERLDSSSIKNRQTLANYEFERGNLLDRLEDYPAAFTAYNRANQAKNLLIGDTYDAAADEVRFGHLKDFFSIEALQSLSQLAAPVPAGTATPVFIIGFPRSGTSLLEQVLGSHPLIAAAGELTFINDLVERKASALLASKLRFPDVLLDPSVALDAGKAARLRDYYLDNMNSQGVVSKETQWVTDKMPHNALHVGLIKLLFPQSPIIHITRHPLNACLSAYFANFKSGHRYTSSLVSTAQHYRQMIDLVQHYRAQGVDMLEIRYEDLVTDQQATVSKILGHIGADWDDACLQHHKSERVVKTASYEQVTQKIYTSSLYRYRNYRKAVEPIIPVLESTIERFGYNTD